VVSGRSCSYELILKMILKMVSYNANCLRIEPENGSLNKGCVADPV